MKEALLFTLLFLVGAWAIFVTIINLWGEK